MRPGRFAHLATGDVVIVNVRGYIGARTAHAVESATPGYLVVGGESFRSCDGKVSGSAFGDHRCARLELR